jgi:hypothetical protein
VNANNFTIDEVTTLDELFACREALLAIRKAVSKIVATLFSNQDEIRRELNAEVAAKLVKYLGSGTTIRNKKFLKSSNRLGWLSIFARNTSRHWIADRVKQSLGDKRVQEALVKCHLPTETFEKYQVRAREFAESLVFDPHQFAGERPRPNIDPDDDASDAYEPAVQYHDTLVDERLVLVRDAVAKLAKRDRTFVNSYFDHARPRTPAERKRFSRLVLRLRDLCHVSQNEAYRDRGQREAAAGQPLVALGCFRRKHG